MGSIIDGIFSGFLGYLTGALIVAIQLSASAHVVLTKRDVRSAIGWISAIWLLPVGGPAFYLLFGVNRLQRKAIRVRRARRMDDETGGDETDSTGADAGSGLALLAAWPPNFQGHARVMGRIGPFPVCAGNRITPIRDGKEAYKAMLAAIEGAKRTVGLSSYIFDSDAAGRAFLITLSAAKRRGVEVRVILDSVGVRYSWPPVSRSFRKRELPLALFNEASQLVHTLHLNLRNHRKILVVDGETGFTGGMNIRAGHMRWRHKPEKIRDLQFRLEGPVVSHLSAIFLDDWEYSAGEPLDAALWMPELPEGNGTALARGIPEGPDGGPKRLRTALISALNMARRTVTIMTPYFLPGTQIMAALSQAAMRGVDVRVVLPAENNLQFVAFAAEHQYAELLEHGISLYLAPGPFDHAKLMIVDSGWVLFGSTNWDARSLDLNFEFNVEAFDTALAVRLERMVESHLETAKRVTMAEVSAFPMRRRLRNGFFWLASPYL